MDASKVKAARGRSPLKASSAVRKAAKNRGKSPGSISFLYGAKARRHWAVLSDLELANFLDLESDPEVVTYDLDPDRIIASLGVDGYVGSKPDAVVLRRSGVREMREVKYVQDAQSDPRALKQIEVQTAAAQKNGYSWRIYSDDDAARQRQRLLNWLSVSGVLSEARDTPTAALERRILGVVDGSKRLSLGALRREIPTDWRLTFVSVFRLQQAGSVSVELMQPLSWETSIAGVLVP